MASSISSGLKTADGIIFAGRNRINAITLIGGSTASSVILYDNASAASGTVLAKATQATSGVTTHIIFENPVFAQDGIYADVTGTSAEYIVYYGG
jgi:hypothetical protein